MSIGELPGNATRHKEFEKPSITDMASGSQMTMWSKDELRKIAEADDLHIAPFREDGVTYGTPTWIWSVAVDNALFARG